MHRFLLLATFSGLAATTACTTDSAPQTDTGQLARIHDQVFAECHDAAGGAYTCGLDVTIANGQFTALGLYDDGSNGRAATGQLTDAAQTRLAGLIAQIPLDTAETVHDDGCGGPPARTTNADVAFDHDGMHHYDIEYAVNGPMADFSRTLGDLITGIRTCNSSDLVFASCDTNTF